MDISVVCRTCLGSTNVSPIFQDPNEFKRYSSALFIIAGVKVEINDGLPQCMCTTCIDFVNSSITFRKMCKDVQTRLLELKHNLIQSLDINVTDDKLTDTVEVTTDRNYIKTELNHINKVEDDKPLQLLKNIILDNTDGNKEVNEINNIVDGKPIQLLKNSIEGNTTIKYIQECLFINEIESSDTEYNKPHTKYKVKKHKINKKVLTQDTELPYSEVLNDTTKKQRVTCKLCYKNLSIRSIDVHMARSHPGADKRKVKCELCDNFVLKEKLDRHKTMMHGTESFKCGYCKSEFDTKELLIDHVSMCISKKKKRKMGESGRVLVECDVCHKQMQKASLRMHKAVTHAGLGPVCEHCGKRLANKFRLQEHCRSKHGYDKFKCSYCDFQSAAAVAMRNHERRHRGEKPFVCERCGAKFHAAYLLAQHRQSHRTEKLVKCDQCPASFKANNSLHTHKLSCHSQRAYRCALCSRAYSCSHYARKHARRAHNHGELALLEPIDECVVRVRTETDEDIDNGGIK